MARLARVIKQMPPTAPHRGNYIAMLQTMAAALKPLQGADGLWRASLRDAAEIPNPETSGSGLFTFAMAWGIRNGHLNAAVDPVGDVAVPLVPYRASRRDGKIMDGKMMGMFWRQTERGRAVR